MSGIDGKWNCIMQTPMGAQHSILDLKSDGQTVTGTSTSTLGTTEVMNGRIEGGSFTWTLEMKVPFPMTLKGQATIAGDKLEGTVAAGMFGKSAITGTREA